MFTGLCKHTDLRDRLVKASGVAGFREIALEMVERRKDLVIEEKLGWYLRYWKGRPAIEYLKGISSPEVNTKEEGHMEEEEKKEPKEVHPEEYEKDKLKTFIEA
jgi:hypothetical protein